jgi:hypothetical protein
MELFCVVHGNLISAGPFPLLPSSFKDNTILGAVFSSRLLTEMFVPVSV